MNTDMKTEEGLQFGFLIDITNSEESERSSHCFQKIKHQFDNTQHLGRSSNASIL